MFCIKKKKLDSIIKFPISEQRIQTQNKNQWKDSYKLKGPNNVVDNQILVHITQNIHNQTHQNPKFKVQIWKQNHNYTPK